MRVRRPWSAVLPLVLAGLLAGCTAGSDGGSDAAASSAAVVNPTQACPQQPGTPATGATTLPALSFRCLGGGTLDLAKAPGVPTVVDLWGSWCPSCRDELPVMQQLADAAGGKVRVVGVISKDGRPEAESFAQDAHVTFPSAFDGQGNLMTKLGLRGLPYSYLVDAGGALVYTQVGPVTSLDQLEQLVADHLGVRL